MPEHPPAGPAQPAAVGAFPPRSRAPSRRSPPAVLAAVVLGGTGGGLARYAVSEAWPTPELSFPWATLTVNTTGAFALALLLVVLSGLGGQRRHLRPLLGTGFLGAFTTFSSVVTSGARLLAHDRPVLAAGYVAGSLVAGLAATLGGLLLGRLVAGPHRRRDR